MRKATLVTAWLKKSKLEEGTEQKIDGVPQRQMKHHFKRKRSNVLIEA
jgi:hypothetical protein